MKFLKIQKKLRNRYAYRIYFKKFLHINKVFFFFQLNFLAIIHHTSKFVYIFQIVKENDWFQIIDQEELRKIIQEILDRYPDLVIKYKKGKKQLYRYFMRQISETTNQRANMKLADKLLKEMLG